MTILDEARKKVRVNSKGKKTRKVKCKKGYKVSSSGSSCVPMSGKEKSSKRRSTRKAVRTKKANPASKNRANRKRRKALKKRKNYGYR
jgi:hypothetical protein